MKLSKLLKLLSLIPFSVLGLSQEARAQAVLNDNYRPHFLKGLDQESFSSALENCATEELVQYMSQVQNFESLNHDEKIKTILSGLKSDLVESRILKHDKNSLRGLLLSMSSERLEAIYRARFVKAIDTIDGRPCEKCKSANEK